MYILILWFNSAEMRHSCISFQNNAIYRALSHVLSPFMVLGIVFFVYKPFKVGDVVCYAILQMIKLRSRKGLVLLVHIGASVSTLVFQLHFLFSFNSKQ